MHLTQGMKTLAAFLLLVTTVPSFAQDQFNPLVYNRDLQNELTRCELRYTYLFVALLRHDAAADRMASAINSIVEKSPSDKKDVVQCLRVKWIYRYASNHSQRFYADLRSVIRVFDPESESVQPAADTTTQPSQTPEVGR